MTHFIMTPVFTLCASDAASAAMIITDWSHTLSMSDIARKPARTQ